MAVLYLSNPTRGAVFAKYFTAELPDMAFHQVTAPDPLAVTHMITWTLPDDLMQTYPNLRMILSVGAGVDQLDLSQLLAHIRVVRMLEPGLAEQMVEYVTMAVLGLHRNLPRYLDQQQCEVWQAHLNTPASMRRVGVMGLGQLGLATVEALRPFGFALSGFARRPTEVTGVDCTTDKAEFLRDLDILVCLLPLADQTEGVLNANLMAQLKPGCGLVQVERGRYLDQDSLLDALESGQISAAWLDVADPEPLPRDHALWAHPQTVVTPHIACQTRPDDAAKHVIAAIKSDLAGTTIAGLIDRSRGY